MRKLIPDFLAAALVLCCVGNLFAADKAGALAPADEQALRAASAGYVKAVNDGDVAGVMKYWADDADYLNDNGDKYKGHKALEKLFNESLESNKGRKFSYDTQSMRMIAPGVVLEDGIGKYNSGDADEQKVASRYSAIWLKSGDKWLISSVRDLGDVNSAGETASSSPLKQLGWLVGEWQSADKDSDVDMSCDYALENKFLKLKYDVKSKDGSEFTVVAMITWDPNRDQLRSWFFDSRGGFGDGEWRRDGNTWTISANGVVADGRRGSMTNVWKYVDDNTAVWQSKDRELDGIPVPESEVKFVRKAEKTETASTGNK